MTACPACGKQAVENGVCSNCGYAQGEGNRCPHCGATARAEPKVEGTITRWVCAMCGGPRIPGGFGGDEAKNALREAKTLFSGATRAKARSIAWWILAVLATLVVALVSAKEALLATIALSLMAIVPAVLGLRARGQASKRIENGNGALDRAWLAAAEEIAAKHKAGITAKELGKALSIDEARADQLLTQLAVHDRTRIDVRDDAEVVYSVRPDVMARVSVDEELTDEGEHDETNAEEKRGRLDRP
jgi:hypothetical protein